jgi:hypothetical protein
MSTPVKVSVVLPTYNRGHVVGDAMRSALGQTYGDLELIVVDDGSTDATPEVVRAFADPRVVPVRARNGGAAGARNVALGVARGELVSFIDSDDLWKPDKLAREIAFLARHPEADAVFADLEKIDGDRFVPSFMRETPVFADRLPGLSAADGVVLGQREMFLVLLEESPVLPTAFTVRRRVFDVTGGFDEGWRSFSDWEFFIRFARRFRYGFIDRPHAVLRISPDSVHRVHSVLGRTAMLRLLARERLTGDPDVRAAARRGMVRLRTQLGWSYSAQGRPVRAALALLRGVQETGDVGLLARALGALAPRAVSARARRLVRRTVSAGA